VAKRSPSAKGIGRPRPTFDIVPEDVKNEYIRMAPQIARSTEEYAEALQAALEAKQLRDEAYAGLYMDICVSLKKKPPEAYIRNEILTTPEYQEACRDYTAAEGRKSRLAGDLEALRTKKDMLVSLGAHVRLELQAFGGGTRDMESEDDEEDDEDL